MLEDDGTLTGDHPMPAAYWRLADQDPIVVRIRAARIPTMPRLAFAGEFRRLSDIYGQRHLDRWWLTNHDAYLAEPTPQRDTLDVLTAAHLEQFTTVIGSCHPGCLFLALPLSRLSDELADAILAAHHARHPRPHGMHIQGGTFVREPSHRIETATLVATAIAVVATGGLAATGHAAAARCPRSPP